MAHVVHSLPHNISIHALRKESDIALSRGRNTGLISIHALRKESDPTFP